MKKIGLLLCVFFALPIVLKSQSTLQNLKKYWYYRKRLKTEYMAVDPDNGGGTNIPSNNRHWTYGDNYITWGDTPVDIAIYLCVLATEYRLLKDYGQDYSETLQEMARALLAIERLDINAEKHFRANGHIYLPQDLNVFFLRNDVDVPCTQIPCREEDEYGNCIEWNYDYCPLYGNIHPNLNILNYNDGLLREDATSIDIEHVGSLYRGGIETNNYSVVSQDQTWWLFLGLAFIAKLVDDETLFEDIIGESSTLNYWAKKITSRLYYAIRHGTDGVDLIWRIRNPVTGELVGQDQGGITWPTCYGFAAAANHICGDDFDNFQSLTSIAARGTFLTYLDMCHLLVSDDNAYDNANGYLNLALIADMYNMNFYRIIFSNGPFSDGAPIYAHLPLMYSVLHGGGCSNGLKSYCEELLNSAYECGSWYYGENAPINRQWCGNRLLGLGGFRWMSDDGGGWRYGFYNGLDYMLYHNLYWLVYEDYSPDQLFISFDLPIYLGLWMGNDDNPFNPEVDNKIIADNTIFEDGNATYTAGYVDLVSGFEVKEGGFFEATSTGVEEGELYIDILIIVQIAILVGFQTQNFRIILAKKILLYNKIQLFQLIQRLRKILMNLLLEKTETIIFTLIQQ